jgi:GLPGLI family protein
MLKYLVFLSVLAANTVQAQNIKPPSDSFSGMVIYNVKVTMRYQGKPTVDTLKFNRQKSFFQWQRKTLKSTTTVTNNNVPKTYVHLNPPPDTIGSYVIYNAVKDSMYSRRRTREMAQAGSKGIFVKECKPDIHWTITDSTKKIGKYNCTMAMTHFRGREYTAWFTPEIPVPYGPWKLIGLPGIILQAQDSLRNIRFRANKISFRSTEQIGVPPLTGREKILDFAQYKKWMTHRRKRIKRKIKAKVLRHQQVMAEKHGHSASGVTVSVSVSEPMEIFGKKGGKD